MAFSGFPQGAQAFLADLATHNDRDWFAENRERYERDLLGPEKEFVAEMASRFPAFDGRVQAVPAVDASIFRIYRDVRFSRDKSPYKNHADLWFWVGSDRKVAVGYFLRLIPGAVWIGGGIHTLTPEQLERYRNAVVSADAGSRLIEAVDAVRAAGLKVDGEQRKRLPSGFTAEGERAELLKYLWLHAMERVSPPPPELARPEFADWCLAGFGRARPLVDWLVEAVG